MTVDQDSKTSPMMAQWKDCKNKAPQCILLFRLGDFYEAFYEDAELIARELDITLTKRQDAPMAGVPFHASEGYIDRLVGKGYRVAIAEQMQDPKTVKGLVKREIVRIVTPGTLINSTLLTEKANNFLACIVQVGQIYGLSVLDLSTADFKAMEFEDSKQLLDELCKLTPKEIVLSEKWQKKHGEFLREIQEQLNPTLIIKEDWHFDVAHATDTLLRHFRVHNLDGFGLKGMNAAINASGAILQYVTDDLNLCTQHIQIITTPSLSQYMLIDRTTQKNLELFETLQEGKKAHTLYKLIDHTQTPMGARMLKFWLTHPLLDVQEIGLRQEAIGALLEQERIRQQIRVHLSQIKDLERLIMRIETGYCSPRDLSALRFSLEHIEPLCALLKVFSQEALRSSCQKLTDITNLVHKLGQALVDTPPLRLGEGGIFRQGFHPELDALRSLQTDSQSWIAQYQMQLKEQTKIKTLKVSYTKAFGFYIEVSKGQADRIPGNFQRRQTLINSERFITPELKTFEHQILHAEEKLQVLEAELFQALREEIAPFATTIRTIAQAVAQLDCFYSLAEAAKKGGYVKPLVDQSDLFFVEQGRHPVIEKALECACYIPNNVLINQDERLHLITGPNMAGKSTFLRQAALIAILAQMGSFVPATKAHIGLIDKVFSRIGASDDVSRGRSTFMVEMTETAHILHNVTDRSLVILDEIGRGTSTYDGIAIAWAVAEYLLKEPGKRAKTLFATHYWELTEMENTIPGAVNYNVAVQESEDSIVFLRKIIRGGTDKSYGIHVARLAGLPHNALRRAEARLKKLEKDAGRNSSSQKQLCLF